MTRILNKIIGCLNEKPHLPKYIILCPDLDLITLADHNGFGVADLFNVLITWLAKNIEQNLDLRQKDIRSKRIGALSASAEPRMIWIKTLIRPFIKGSSKAHIFAQCKKFNEILEQVVQNFKHTHLMEVILPEDHNIFDRMGNLTSVGKITFWREINMQMRASHKGKIDLCPWEFSKKDVKYQRKFSHSYQKGDFQRKNKNRRSGSKHKDYHD